VFKVIKDFYPPQKDTTREQIKGKYLLVKQHDRVGRMADTLEYSNVAFPRAASSPSWSPSCSILPPARWRSPSDGDGETELIIKHLYIERRMIPLNIYLQEAFDATPASSHASPEQMSAVVEYGNAIKDLVAANIFPGDMLWKNFGVTRHGKVVFYDYDEIEYITDCNFRRVPAPRNEEDEMSARSGTAWARRTSSPRPSAPSCWATRGARGVHAAPRRPAGRRLLAGHKERIRAGMCTTCSPTNPAGASGGLNGPRAAWNRPESKGEGHDLGE
jgi:isocitrate dehydrogenase kinase/phosphatase